ncbi:TnsA endonuclease N-terminal domain-containing protein [Marinifilum caeruleilacunae]|uniref:TnsA endonuclease N-terminal domain-containing protein n=1 Tax=Marinifilum caeruleilacunae TaxID=2499076 RepID=A0ABX1WSA3_9BACT|nr:TnsA endonuclease N-terminal domain-containing protein [Marinifilum caeruleilacunae]NOU58876.1 hypothetical protein [Marinifilum caeruleilacunae]
MMLNFNKRIREIPLKNSSLSGVINSSQINKIIQFESSLERDFIYLLEFDIYVDKYLEQPLEISYNDTIGNSKKYIPDFAISYLDDRPNEIIEIKHCSSLQEKQEELIPKFRAAEQFCEENNSIFKVITEEHIRKDKGIELENYKFLSRYRNYFNNLNSNNSVLFTQNSDHLVLYNRMFEFKKCTVKYLIDQCTSDFEKKAELLFLTWCLVATNFFSIDFTKKINTNSIIWYNE